MTKKKYLILIAGPTAVGKSDTALTVAEYFSTDILSADSRQCFKELSVGTAVPPEEYLHRVKHHFIQTHSVHDDMNAAVYEKYGLNVLSEVFQKRDIAVVCGGTGLYIQALLYGMDDMPEVDRDIEYEVNKNYKERGIEYLEESLKREDPLYADEGNMQNPARMIRALIFYRSHQKSILEYRKNISKHRNFSVIKTGLEVPREELYERINGRVDRMMQEGLLDEVGRMYKDHGLKALRTVGYQEFYDWGHWPLTESEINISIDKIKQNTRRYAKRQMTWFKNREHLEWFHPAEDQLLLEYINAEIKRGDHH